MSPKVTQSRKKNIHFFSMRILPYKTKRRVANEIRIGTYGIELPRCLFPRGNKRACEGRRSRLGTDHCSGDRGHMPWQEKNAFSNETPAREQLCHQKSQTHAFISFLCIFYHATESKLTDKLRTGTYGRKLPRLGVHSSL